MLTELAAATYPDGSVPPVDEVVKLATFLFAAGTDTTTKLVSTAMRVLGERQDIQKSLRDDRSQIPAFLEECLRMESPVKSHFRLARTSTTIGDYDVPAGTILMMLPGASNRDPRKFEDPNEFKHDRSNVREHVALGAVPIPAPARRWRGRRRASRSIGSSTGWPTSASPRRCTGRPTIESMGTNRHSSCAA